MTELTGLYLLILCVSARHLLVTALSRIPTLTRPHIVMA